METKFDMFDLLKSLEKKNEKINSVFDCDASFLDKEISMLWGIIENDMNIVSSDKSGDILCDFGCGDITKKEAVMKLKKLAR